MAVTNLRDYLKGIEELVDSGQVEDALAHCRQVLKTYPKHVDTYRLMGKAYLESKRHSEANDLFQRVLSSVPDDFVSHIGMSIIREDEGNQNAAIWHMERAFESQPSNRAVQDELRRLYGQREGYEPPKVRLTRGALARMYSHGDLYNQAIAELRNALIEDPQRPDLEVLLAEMYFKTNQHAQAVDVCAQIIHKLPYCLYANRVMVDILRASQREAEAAPYRQRVEELDPYAAQVSTLKDVEQVPADSVAIEPLQIETPLVLGAPKSWNGAQTQEPEFEPEELPDWLSSDSPESAPSAESVEPGSVLSSLEAEEESPAADAEPEAPSSAFPKSGALLQPDHIPDWLRELRPTTGMLADSEGGEMEPEEPAQQSWTDELKRAGFKPTGPLDMGEIEDAGDAEAETPAPPPVTAGLGMSVLATSELHWLDAPLDGEEPAPAEPAAAAEEEILEDGETDLQPRQDAPAETAPIPVTRPLTPPPDWMDEFKAASTAAPQSEEETEEIAAADEEVASRLEALDWDAQPAEESAAQQTSEPQTPPMSQEDQDNLGWLESLAARRGAAEDELLTTPEERERARPEWLQASEGETEPQPADSKSETLNWLDELAAAAGPVAAATDDPGLDEQAAEGTPFQEAQEEEDTPDWLRRISAEMQSRERSVTGSIGPRPLEDAPDWLRELREQEGGEAEPTGGLSWLDEEEAGEENTAPTPSVEPTWVPANQMEAEPAPSAEPEPESEPESERAPEPAAELHAEAEALEIEKVAEVAEVAAPETQPEPQDEPISEELQPAAASQPQAARPRPRRLDPEQLEERLAQARQALSYGNIDDAVENYGFFLRRRARLEEVIADLRAALRRFPRQVSLWQALGDAYMRNNQITDALDCYSRAESLL